MNDVKTKPRHMPEHSPRNGYAEPERRLAHGAHACQPVDARASVDVVAHARRKEADLVAAPFQGIGQRLEVGGHAVQLWREPIREEANVHGMTDKIARLPLFVHLAFPLGSKPACVDVPRARP